MFNSEFYQLCDQLHVELTSLRKKYPSMYPTHYKPNTWCRITQDATLAANEFARALLALGKELAK